MSGRRTLGAGLSLGALAALPATAQADDFKVTNLKNSGAGSLRTAIDDADDAGGPDRILFKSKLSGAIQLKGTPLEVQGGDVRIVGPGARRVTVSAPYAERAFEVRGSVVPDTDMDVTISGLTLTGGDARNTSDEDGGAIFAIGEVDLTLSRVTITGNTAVDGGGVALKPYGTYAELVVEDSTISGNSATATGGGIYGQGANTRISNSTISGNEAANVGGGAAVLQSASDRYPSFEVRNTTVTRNEAGSGGGLAASFSPYVPPPGFPLVGTIVAGNTATTNPDLEFGPWNSAFSLIGEVGTADFDDEGGNLIDVDPKLKPLKNNGGPTDTHAFKKSPVKNKVPKSESEKKDQRGAPRKGKGDIGAYELVKCEGVIVNRVGTGKKDKLKGTKKKDGILGLGGNDKLFGKKGKDGLCGGKGKDTLKGGPGKDKLDGGPGKDKEIQ
jgi:Right handed beta helix region/RTX calcium-binding nonapeptide repeat (4 copies)